MSFLGFVVLEKKLRWVLVGSHQFSVWTFISLLNPPYLNRIPLFFAFYCIIVVKDLNLE
jgi:hypothetical protein